MLRATLKNLLSRKVRLILSGLAVVLGVMFVSGAFVLTDTLGRSFDALFANVYSSLDVQVSGKVTAKAAEGGGEVQSPVPASVVNQVRSVPGVSKAVGSVFTDGARVVDPRTGKVLSTFSSRFGGNWTGGGTLIRLRTGHSPEAPDQVVINGGLARTGGFHLGDRIQVLTLREQAHTFTVTGIFEYSGGRDSLAGETVVLFTTPVAQQLMIGQPDVFNAVDVTAEAGTAPATLRDRIAGELGGGYVVNTGAELTKQQTNQVKKGLSFINYILLGFAGVALFVGIFIILNTFSIIIAQRMRELAMVRAIGASRSQVLLSVLVEAIVIGLVASVVGLAAGIGVGGLLAWLLGKLTASLRLAGIGVPPSAIIAAFTVGLFVTLVAALLPALRASRIPPVAAMQEAAAPDRPLFRLTASGAVLTGVGAAGLAFGLTRRGDGSVTLWTILVSILVTFVGVALLTPVISRPVVSVLGKVFAWSMPGELGRRNTRRNPRRTAITAAALMVGVALVTAISTVYTSAAQSIDKQVNQGLKAQLVIAGQQRSAMPPTFDPAVLRAAREVDGVRHVAGVYFDSAEIGNSDAVVYATDSLPDLAAIAQLRTTGGALGVLQAGQLVVDKRTASDRHLKVGDTVQVRLARAQAPEAFRIVGVYDNGGVVNGMIMSAVNAAQFRTPNPTQGFVDVGTGGDVAAVKDRLNGLLANSPEVSVQDRSDFVKQQTSIVNTILGFIQILLALAMIIAVLGIINTLVLSVIERTRELGLLRAIGMRRAQTVRMVTVESVVISVFGALLGIVVGVGLGAAVVRALHDQGFSTLALPWRLMVTYLVLAGVVGVIAAVIPAWRAARLNVLQAIAYE